MRAGADVVVTGEVGYHRAQDLSLRGMGVVALGHDRSEQPFCSILADVCVSFGVPAEHVYVNPLPTQWWVPTHWRSGRTRICQSAAHAMVGADARRFRMSLGSDLIKLQETDLELAKLGKQLGSLPIIDDELAKKRAALTKLRAEATRLLAVRKDAQIAVDDLDEGERACHEAVAAAQARSVDPSDYRAMRDLEEELSNLAKRLERIEFDRPEAREALAAAEERRPVQ